MTQGIKSLHYINAGDGLFAIYEWKENKENLQKEMYYIHKDHLGSYQTITNQKGAVVELRSYDPWGRLRNPINWNFDEYQWNYKFDRGYTGHEHMSEYNLINMNGRVYDPWLGRMLSPDPILQAPSNSQNYNRYTYAMNNPLKYTDPSGYYNEDAPWETTGLRGNPTLANIRSNTAHGLNAANGTTYGSYTYKNGKYVNTWSGQEASWQKAQGFYSHYAINFGTLGEFSNYMATEYSTASNREMVQYNLTGNYYDREIGNGKINFYIPHTNISIDPFSDNSGRKLSVASTGGGELADGGITMQEAGVGMTAFGLGFTAKSNLYQALEGSNNAPKYFKSASKFGTRLSYLGLGLTAYDGYSNGWQNSHSADMLIQSTLITISAINPVVGGVAAGVYFIGDLGFQHFHNGQSMTQFYLDN
jgi:RHS repeat-associated protein